MIGIPHQEAIEISLTEGGVIEIRSESFELGRDVSIFIQPENVKRFCDALLEVVQSIKD